MKKIFLLVWLLMFSSLSVTVLSGSETLESSPWVGWRKAFQAYDQAEVYKNDRNYKQALIYYTRGRDYFAAIRRNFPDWNSKVVSDRVALCEKCIREMQDLVGEKSPGKSGGRSADTSSDNRSGGGNTKKPSAPQEDFSSRLYMEMQSEIDQYRTRLRKALAEIDALQIKLKQSEANVRDVESVLRENRLLQEKYSLLEMQFKELQNQTKGVDRERYEAQLVSLKQANEQALKRVIELENELKNKDREYAQSRAEVLKYRQSVLDLTNDIKRLQHEISVLKVRAAAAEDKKKLEFRIKELEVELAGKNQRIDQLMKLLSM